MDPHNVHCCYTLLSTASRDDEQLACKNCRYIQLSGKKKYNKQNKWLIENKNKNKKNNSEGAALCKKDRISPGVFLFSYLHLFYFLLFVTSTTISSRHHLGSSFMLREISIINYSVSSSITCIKSIVCSHDNPST